MRRFDKRVMVSASLVALLVVGIVVVSVLLTRSAGRHKAEVSRRPAATLTMATPHAAKCPAKAALPALIMRLDAHGPSDPHMGVDGAGPGTYGVFGGLARIDVGEGAHCFGDWAVVNIVGYFIDPNATPAEDSVVLHWSNGHWVLYINGGTDHRGTYLCQPPVPVAVRAYLKCD